MQHPFEGVLDAGQENNEVKTTRRSLLGKMFGAVAGLLGLASVASARQSPGRTTERASTMRLGSRLRASRSAVCAVPVGRNPSAV